MFKHRQLLIWDFSLALLLFALVVTTTLLFQQMRQFILTSNVPNPLGQPESVVILQPALTETNPPNIALDATSPPALPETNSHDTVPGTVNTEVAPTPETNISSQQFFSLAELERYQSLEISQRLIPDLNTVPIHSFSGVTPTIPKDVLDQLGYDVPGGGGPGCGREHSVPRIDNLTDEQISLGEDFRIVHTGWAAGETVVTKTTLPSGEVLEEEQIIESIDSNIISCDFYHHTTNWNEPLGTYEVTLIGNETTLRTSVVVAPPSQPTLFETDNGLLMYGFAPNERVRLFLYDHEEGQFSSRLIGWEEYIFTEKAVLAVLIPTELLPDKYLYFVVGEISGVHGGGPILFIPAVSGANQYNIVTGISQSTILTIRSEPSLDRPIVAEVPSETQMFVMAAGRYDEVTGTRWLPVRTDTGIDGWIEEARVQVIRIANYDELPQ